MTVNEDSIDEVLLVKGQWYYHFAMRGCGDELRPFVETLEYVGLERRLGTHETSDEKNSCYLFKVISSGDPAELRVVNKKSQIDGRMFSFENFLSVAAEECREFLD